MQQIYIYPSLVVVLHIQNKSVALIQQIYPHIPNVDEKKLSFS